MSTLSCKPHDNPVRMYYHITIIVIIIIGISIIITIITLITLITLINLTESQPRPSVSNSFLRSYMTVIHTLKFTSKTLK